MAVAPEGDELLLEDELKPNDEGDGSASDQTDEAEDVEQEQQDEAEAEGEADAEEEFLTFGDEAAPASSEQGETNLVKHLRDELRKRSKELDELRKAAPAVQAIEVGEKPTLAACDYDEEAFERELEAWNERKRKAEAQQNEARQAQQRQREEHEAELKRYHEGKAALGFADVEDAETTVVSTLSEVQQATLVHAALEPAKVIYALARHPAQLAELAKITNPLKLAAAVARLEGNLKVVKRRKAPEPDRPERGSGVVSGSRDKQLERLEAEAAKTGDRTKLIAYRKQLKARGK